MNRKNFLKSSIFFAFFVLLLGGVWGQTTYTWTGDGGDTAWENASNWDVGGVPTDGADVLIPDLTPITDRYPVLSSTINLSSLTIVSNASLMSTANAQVKKLTIKNNAKLTISSSGTLSVSELLVEGSGKIDALNGSIVFGGVSSSWKADVPEYSSIGNLSVSSGSTLQLGSDLYVENLSVEGTLLSNEHAIFASSITGGGTLTATTGEITVSGDFDVNSFTAGTSTVNLYTNANVSAHSFATLNITGGTRTLTGDVTAQTFTSATGTDIAGPHNLTISGNAVFSGTVGSGTALTSLTVNGTSTINTTTITTSSAQTYTGAVTLGANTTLAANNGLVSSDIEMGNDLNGTGNSLTVDGNFSLSNASPSVTNLPTLVFTGSNAQTFNPGGASFSNLTFTTTNTITLTDAMTVTGNVTVNGAGAVVDFASYNTGFSQNTGQNFTITNGTVNIGTGQFLVGILSVDSGCSFTQTGDNGTNTQSAESISGDGAINWDNGDDGGTLELAASTASNINFHHKAVIISSASITLSGIFYDLIVPSAYILNLGGKITILNNLTNNGTIGINSQELEFLNYIEGVSSLVSISSGKITSTNSSSQDMSRLNFTSGNTATINGGGGISLLSPVYNTAGIISTGIVSLSAGTIASLDVQSGTTSIGDIDISGDLSVTGTLNASTSTITFSGTNEQTINPGTHTINTINIAKTGGSISFTTNPLTVTSLNQSNSVNFVISFNENLSVTNAVIFNTAGTVTLGNAVTDTFTFSGGLSHIAGDTVLSGNIQTVNQNISLRNLALSSNASLASGSGSISIGGNTTGAGHNLSTSGDTNFSGTVSGLGSLKITGNAVFDGAVSSTASIEVNGTSAINGDITTSGIQMYGGDVTLGGTNATITLTANDTNSTVTFNNKVMGNNNSLSITGDVVFGNDEDDTVIGVNELAVSGTSTINTTTITTTGAQTYDKDVILGANTTLTTTNSDIKFDSKLDGSHTLSLTTGSGDITFGNTVGEKNPLGSLTITSAEDVSFTGNISAASFTQIAGTGTTTFEGIQNYSGDFLFTGENLTVNNAFNAGGYARITNQGLFTKNSTGVVTVTGTFIQDGDGLNSLGANITTTDNNINFSTGITLLEDVQLST